MENYELYLPHNFSVEKRNPVTGRFEKGHMPANKGVKMPDEIREKIKHTFFPKGHKPKNHYHLGGKHTIPVEMWHNGKIIGVFRSIGEAEMKTGIQRRNINKVVSGERKSAGGFVWKRANIK